MPLDGGVKEGRKGKEGKKRMVKEGRSRKEDKGRKEGTKESSMGG
jgi:hypothetical protein